MQRRTLVSCCLALVCAAGPADGQPTASASAPAPARPAASAAAAAPARPAVSASPIAPAPPRSPARAEAPLVRRAPAQERGSSSELGLIDEEGRFSIDKLVGGEKTCRYGSVGAILRKTSTHCTGTLVGAKAVLTAGHCLDDRYNGDEMSFFVGCERGDGDTYGIVKRFREGGYAWNSAAHDLGVVCLARAVESHRAARIASAPPKVNEVLTFVGFGYSDQGRHVDGLGEKRFVNMPVASVDPLTFTSSSPSAHTCNGDSGGPAFDRTNALVGVVSKGNAGCTGAGVNALASSDRAWIDRAVRACDADP